MHRRGFTLIELLVVIGIISVLMFMTVLAINPGRQLAEARNAQRLADINTIINGIHQYFLDHDALPQSIPVTAREICRTGPSGLPCTNGVRLEMLSGTYIAALPVDPLTPQTSTGTSYWVIKDPAGRVTVIAPFAERNINIYTTR